MIPRAAGKNKGSDLQGQGDEQVLEPAGGRGGGLADGGRHRGGVGPRAEGERAIGSQAADGQRAAAEPPMAIWVPTAPPPTA